MTEEEREMSSDSMPEESAEDAVKETSDISDHKRNKNKENKDKEKDKKISRLEGELAECQKEIKKRDEVLIEAQNKLNRMLLEFDNFKKRTLREKEAAHDEAVCEVMENLLPVLDTLESAAQIESDPELAKGITMTLSAFKSVLTKYHVEECGAPGEPFDPDLHNAVAHIDSDELGENVIATVFRKGYRLGDKVIRPAMVQVAN